MKPYQAFAVACLLPLTVLTAVGIAAARALPESLTRPESVKDATPAAPAAVAEDDLHHHMEVLQDGMKAMRKMLGKEESKADLLALLPKLQTSTLACFTLLPKPIAPHANAVAEAEWRVDYLRRMVQVYDTLLQLELAVHKDDTAAVKELHQALGKQKNDGHEVFQAE